MLQRIATGSLAAIFLATSGLGGAVLHLCQMEGLTRSTCGCDHSKFDAVPGAQVERPDDCCQVLQTQTSRAFAGVHVGDSNVGSSLLLGSPLVPVAGTIERSELIRWVPTARGPPLAHGPPIFIRNCSYLI